jgi:hypothetical protein
MIHLLHTTIPLVFTSPYSVVKTCLVKVDTSKQQHINEDFFLKLSRVVRARQWMMRGGVK